MSKQMQRFGLRWVKRPAAVALLLLIGMAGEAATFVAYTNITYAGSSTDAIADMWPVNLYYNYGGQAGYYGQLADGNAANSLFCYSYTSTLVYAYGVADTNEYVSRVDGWVHAGENARNDFDFEIGFSSDGVTFTNLIRGNNGNTPAFVNAFNLGRFLFDPGETRGMGYIRIISIGPGGYGARIAEIDVFTERVPSAPGPRPYTLTFTKGIPLDQSPTDVINGKSPVYPQWYSPGGQHWLNDATSPAAPADVTMAYEGTLRPVTNIWDLGMLSGETWLDRVDVWFENLYDSPRTPLRAGVAVSADNAVWRNVATTGGRACTNLPHSLARMQFRRAAVTGFRYVALIDYPCAEYRGLHGRLVELDVFLKKPTGTALLVR